MEFVEWVALALFAVALVIASLVIDLDIEEE
jgi:hypothetical protein